MWFLLSALAAKPPPPASTEAVVEPSPGPMSNARLARIFASLDPSAQKAPNYWEFEVAGVQIVVLTDENADRMRIVAPIAPASTVTGDRAVRLLQANFDSALDARYAIARNMVWSAFIHPLSSLTEDELQNGVAQVVGCAKSYGTTYNSGALVFGGGDSAEAQHKLYQQVLEEMERTQAPM